MIDETATLRSTVSPRRALVAATAGNLLESYDFAVYGYFAVTLSRLFFPAGNATTSLLLAVATFDVGFAIRPLGAQTRAPAAILCRPTGPRRPTNQAPLRRTLAFTDVITTALARLHSGRPAPTRPHEQRKDTHPGPWNPAASPLNG